MLMDRSVYTGEYSPGVAVGTWLAGRKRSLDGSIFSCLHGRSLVVMVSYVSSSVAGGCGSRRCTGRSRYTSSPAADPHATRAGAACPCPGADDAWRTHSDSDSSDQGKGGAHPSP